MSLSGVTKDDTATEGAATTTNKEGTVAETDFSDSSMTEIKTQGPGGFGCRLPQLVELIAERGTQGMERFHVRFGGPDGLAKKLKSDIKAGITGTEDDIAVSVKECGGECRGEGQSCPVVARQSLGSLLLVHVLCLLCCGC